MRNILEVATRLLIAGRSKDRIETDITRTWGLSQDQRQSLREHLNKLAGEMDARKAKQAV